MSSNRSCTKQRFDSLEQPVDSCLVTYVWIASDGKHVGFKTRTFDFEPLHPGDVPWWDHADDDLDRYVEPKRLFNDPFYLSGGAVGGNSHPNRNKIVLCESFHADKVSIPSKLRFFSLQLNFSSHD